MKIPTIYGRTRSSLLTVGVTTPSSVVTLCAHIWRAFLRLATTTLAKSGFKVAYHNVKRDPEAMEKMLAISGGKRQVPVIQEGEKTSIGFKGT